MAAVLCAKAQTAAIFTLNKLAKVCYNVAIK